MMIHSGIPHTHSRKKSPTERPTASPTFTALNTHNKHTQLSLSIICTVCGSVEPFYLSMWEQLS